MDHHLPALGEQAFDKALTPHSIFSIARNMPDEEAQEVATAFASDLATIQNLPVITENIPGLERYDKKPPERGVSFKTLLDKADLPAKEEAHDQD